MKNTKAFMAVPLGFLSVSILAVILTFFIPTPAEASETSAAHWRAAASTAPIFLLVGAATIFLKGSGSFKAARTAYRWLAYGMLLFSILFLQVAAWGLYDMWDSAWATSGVGILPLAASMVVIYVAVRKFSLVLQIKHLLTRGWLMIGLTILAGVAMGIIAALFVTYDIEGTELYIAVCAWSATFVTAATLLMHRISRTIGASYREAMKLLTISLAAFSVSVWHESISTLWFNNGSTYTDYGFYLLPWTVSGLIILYASYRFRLMTTFVRSTDELPAQTVSTRDYIDSLVAVTELASRPQEIDTIREDMSLITASIDPDQPLSTIQKEKLLQIYHQLEAYLTQHDPLRTVTREELLNRVTPGFRAVLEHRSSDPA